MTQEQAINEVKKAIPTFRKETKEAIETLVPELKENEDEKIRKTLIHIVKGACSKYGIKYKGDEITEEKLLTYLEKQKELPFVKDVMLGYPGIYFYDGERMHFQGNPAVEEKQKEQKPRDESGTAEPDYGICDSYIPAALHHALKRHGWYACHIGEDDEIIKECRDYVARNWPADKDTLTQDHQPAEWSEENEEHLDSIIESYKELLKDYFANHGVDYIPYNTPVVTRTVLNDINFLKSLRRPYSKRESSEEDKKILYEIIRNINAYNAYTGTLFKQLESIIKR